MRASAPTRSSSSPGKLFVVGTPIGNLEDITFRALRTLKEADLIACEDTRRTQLLLNRYTIRTPTVSYHEHNEMTRAPELIVALEQGARIALVSDAGMPLVSDPGHRLVSLCVRHRIPVVPVHASHPDVKFGTPCPLDNTIEAIRQAIELIGKGDED